MHRFGKWLGAAGAAALALGLGNAAQADPFTVNLQSVAPSATNVGAFTYTYLVTVAPLEDVGPETPGDFFSIMDFAGFVPGSAASGGTLAGLTAFTYPLITPVALAGPDPGSPDPAPVGADSPTIGNLLFRYTGTSILSGGATGFVFTLTADSTIGTTVSDFYYGQTSDNTGPVRGFISSSGPVGVPGASAVVPEPGTMTLLGMGALGALGLIRRRRAA